MPARAQAPGRRLQAAVERELCERYGPLADEFGEVWVDDDGGYVYFESDDCRATIKLLAESPGVAAAWGSDTYKIQCFDVTSPTTSTPGYEVP